MKWTLREKSDKEIQDAVSEQSFYNHLVKGRSAIKSDICPLEVTMSNGDVKDVWSLTEQEVFGLIKKMSSEMESGNRDNKRVQWAGQIIQCWGEQHPTISAKMSAELVKLTTNAKTPVGREVVRDFMGPIANKSLEEAKTIARYLKGNMNAAVSDAELLNVLENMAEMSNSREI